MNVNTDIWGNSSEWLINTDLSNTSWQDTNLLFYDGKYRSLNDYRTNNIFDYNTPIDYSICYAAHAAAEKMPLADIALYDYQGNKRGEQTETNGFFFGVNSGISSDAWFYFREMTGYINDETTSTSIAGTSMWSPNGVNYSSEYPRPFNLHQYIQPIVQFSPKSMFFVVYVDLVSNDYQSMITVSLKTLKNNIATYSSNYFIHRAYMLPYCYNGRVSQDGNYSNYVRKTPNNGGVSAINNIKLLNSTKTITTYEQTIGALFSLPIMGTVESVKEYRATDSNKYYGCMIAPHDENNSETWSIAVSSDKIDNVTVTYHRTNAYGYIYLLHTKISITADIVEDIMRGAAAYGLFFSDDVNGLNVDTTNTSRWLNVNMYCGVLDENGVGHGEYTQGTQNTSNQVYQWDNSSDSPYEPSRPIDPNVYSDTTNWNNVDFRQSFTKRYLLTGAQVAQLSTELWAAQSSKPADIDYSNFAIDEYLTNNPIDTVVSLKYFPCTFADIAPAVVHLGKYTTNIAATALGTSVRIIDFAPIDCFPHFGDFRDYEPYTELAMYVPFCGTVKIPTAECMGNYVSVKLAIDTNTGAATGYIIVSKTGSGGICVATCQGMAAIDIPVSGLQSANLANAVFNATANWTQTQVNNISANSGLFKHMGGAFGAIARGMTNSFGLSDVKGGVLGGPIGAAGTLVNSLNPISALQKGMNIDIDNAKADYELTHIQVPTRLVGSASPVLGCVIELDCRLIIYRPVTDETALSNYADTVGFATVKGGTVSQFSGFTVGTIDVSGINATAKEKQAIAAAFANGVYL